MRHDDTAYWIARVRGRRGREQRGSPMRLLKFVFWTLLVLVVMVVAAAGGFR